MSKTISVRIDDTLHNMVKDEANNEGKTINEKLKGMLNQHFNGETENDNSNLSQIAENSESILSLQKKQENLDENLKEIFKLLDNTHDRISKGEKTILEAINERINIHESKYKHDMKCRGFGNSN